jgi:hypothetical protein
MIAYVNSGQTVGAFSPPGNAFTSGATYNVSGMIEIA